MTTLYLIRHGITEYNLEHRIHGQADPPLTSIGWDQLPYLVEYCSELSIDSIFSSPLIRAKETATAIAKRLELDVNLVPGLMERDLGPLENVLVKNVHKYLPEDIVRNMKQYPGRLIAPGVEHPKDIQNRIYQTIQKIMKEQNHNTVCIVSHEAVMNLFLAKVWKVEDLSNFQRVVIPNSSVTKLEYDSDQFHCVYYGDDHFLPEKLRRSIFSK